MVPKVRIYAQTMAHLHGGATTFAQPHCIRSLKDSLKMHDIPGSIRQDIYTIIGLSIVETV